MKTEDISKLWDKYFEQPDGPNTLWEDLSPRAKKAFAFVCREVERMTFERARRRVSVSADWILLKKELAKENST